MGDSPKRWDTLVSHKPVCVKTLVPFWRFKILEVWIIPTSTVLCAALRKYKLGNVGEISYGILYYPHILYIYYPHPSQRTSSRLFRHLSFLMSHVEPTGQYPVEAAHRSLQCLAALHDAHNHGLKWPHSVISDSATGKIHHFIWGIVPLFFLRLWTMFHCHAMENQMFFTVNR